MSMQFFFLIRNSKFCQFPYYKNVGSYDKREKEGSFSDPGPASESHKTVSSHVLLVPCGLEEALRPSLPSMAFTF